MAEETFRRDEAPQEYRVQSTVILCITYFLKPPYNILTTFIASTTKETTIIIIYTKVLGMPYYCNGLYTILRGQILLFSIKFRAPKIHIMMC